MKCYIGTKIQRDSKINTKTATAGMIDRRTVSQTDVQTNDRADKRIDRWTRRRIDRYTDNELGEQTDIWSGKFTDRLTDIRYKKRNQIYGLNGQKDAQRRLQLVELAARYTKKDKQTDRQNLQTHRQPGRVIQRHIIQNDRQWLLDRL